MWIEINNDICNVNCYDVEIFGKRRAREVPGPGNAKAEIYFWIVIFKRYMMGAVLHASSTRHLRVSLLLLLFANFSSNMIKTSSQSHPHNINISPQNPFTIVFLVSVMYTSKRFSRKLDRDF